MSEDIIESKRRGVFVYEYFAKNNPYILNDSLRLNIKSAWLEKQWQHGKSSNKTVVSENDYQLIMEVDPDGIKNYGRTWRIGISGDRYFRTCGKSCLMSDFTSLPNKIEAWQVQSGWRLDTSSTKRIIGTFKIYRDARIP